MQRLTLGLRLLLDHVAIDVRVLALLTAIAKHGSLRRAAVEVQLSYRHAWELLGRLESSVGHQLVQLERGRGATLTALGEQLAAGTNAIEKRLASELKGATAELNRALALKQTARYKPLRLCASHDFALGKLAEMLPRHGAPEVALRFQGSLDALLSLSHNRCDIAGFHMPGTSGRQALIEPYYPLLKSRALRLVHFANRRQGLIVAKRNPLKIEGLADLTRPQVRFVNRQPGSGTRLFFDTLLATHRLRPTQINGYRREEFTHAAVAAMIATGTADAAFGIETAAALLDLSFVPIASEQYFLAMRAATVSSPSTQAFLKALESRWFRKMVSELPGYTAPPHVTPVSVQEALEIAQ